jgi:type I site-specific restriction-modification system R (restriction) subunit
MSLPAPIWLVAAFISMVAWRIAAARLLPAAIEPSVLAFEWGEGAGCATNDRGLCGQTSDRLPNAAFIGFTGTPLFEQDQITKRIFGDYVSRYDFKRSEEDGATVKLVYENRGEKLGVARADLNDRIATKIEEAELDPDQAALLDKLLGKDYEVITADERLDKIAADFVNHCTTRWESGKSMFVCIDKITCARMHQRIVPRWKSLNNW